MIETQRPLWRWEPLQKETISDAHNQSELYDKAAKQEPFLTEKV